jgi:hypothetical protein
MYKIFKNNPFGSWSTIRVSFLLLVIEIPNIRDVIVLDIFFVAISLMS